MGAHLHLDPIGGAAGDMFAAALLDLDPSLGEGLVPLLRAAGLAPDVGIDVVEHRDTVLRGRRFLVEDPRERDARGRTRPLPGAFVLRAGSAAHPHVPARDILRAIADSPLPPRAKERATDVFRRIAVAEAGVHGMSVDEVALHEVGAQDSVADIVAAAVLLTRLEEKHGPLTASCGSIPLGSGRVQSAHGELPIPAPAALALLQGHVVHDDGRPGERVTPTGAAIIAHLVTPGARRPPGRVVGSGVGFGAKTFVGLSNVLRVTLTTTAVQEPEWDSQALCVLACEIDDMTAEELAVAAETLRGTVGVVDVVQAPVTMKKGRAATTLQVSCAAEHRADVARAVFSATSTLGLRVLDVERLALSRTVAEHDGVRVKRAARPGGATFKADIDDVGGATLAERRARRLKHEQDLAGREPR